jgi:hypothetical protein
MHIGINKTIRFEHYQTKIKSQSKNKNSHTYA